MTNFGFEFWREGRTETSSSTTLCRLLRWFGFEERVRGSHHIFRKQGVQDRVNLQRDGRKAKVYQVRQVRRIILMYRLEGEASDHA